MTNAIGVTVITTLLTGGMWSMLLIHLSGKAFEMDFNSGRHSFHTFLAIYRQIYSGIFVFGIILFMIEHGFTCRTLLALSSVYALLMILWVTFCYEHYQHDRYQPNGLYTYTGWKYALTLTLGAMSPILFAIGLLMAAEGSYGK